MSSELQNHYRDRRGLVRETIPAVSDKPEKFEKGTTFYKYY